MAQHSTFDSAFKSMYKKLSNVQKTLPSVLANVGTNFFIGNFDKEGFDDGGVKKWQAPQRKIAGTDPFKYPKKRDLGRRTRKTLVKTGKLRRAVNNSNSEKTFKRIAWRVRLPYAARHNEGLSGMPQRQYMGKSKTLNKLFRTKITQAYAKSLNNG